MNKKKLQYQSEKFQRFKNSKNPISDEAKRIKAKQNKDYVDFDDELPF